MIGGLQQVARTGRKRKSGRRNRSGDIKQPKPNYAALAALQPHRAWLPENARLSEKAGTPLGGLNLIGVLTDEHHEAGQRYAAIVGAYRAVIESPKGFNNGGRGFDCAGCPRIREPESECACEQRKWRYDAAFAAVMDAGHRSARAVARVAVHGEACPTGSLNDLIRGLDALRKHFGLTNHGKSVHLGNRH